MNSSSAITKCVLLGKLFMLSVPQFCKFWQEWEWVWGGYSLCTTEWL